jgi:hypothetical protein
MPNNVSFTKNQYVNSREPKLNTPMGIQEGSAVVEADTPIATKQQMLDFRANIYKWLGHDDKMREYRTAMKKINQDKNEVTHTIIQFMEKYEVKDLTTSNGNLKYSVRTRKKINKDTLLKALSKYFDDDLKGKTATKYVLDNVPTVHIPYIKRSKKSKKPSTDTASISSKKSITNNTGIASKPSTDTASISSKSKKPSTDTASISSKSKKPFTDTSSITSKQSITNNTGISSKSSRPVQKKYKITRKIRN